MEMAKGGGGGILGMDGCNDEGIEDDLVGTISPAPCLGRSHAHTDAPRCTSLPHRWQASCGANPALQATHCPNPSGTSFLQMEQKRLMGQQRTAYRPTSGSSFFVAW
jgi:hypothetical protein